MKKITTIELTRDELIKVLEIYYEVNFESVSLSFSGFKGVLK